MRTGVRMAVRGWGDGDERVLVRAHAARPRQPCRPPRCVESRHDGRGARDRRRGAGHLAVDLDRHVKSIDNALQRVKRKLEKYMDNRGEDVDINTVYRGLSSINRRLHDLEDANTNE